MFLTPLKLVAAEQPDQWYFEAPLVWQDPIFGRLTAPVGARTDLASIPRALRNLPFLDPDGPSRLPAAMHDCLYRLGRAHGKRFADDFLRAALLSEGANEATAWAFWRGVSWFGRGSWNSDTGTRTAADFDTREHYRDWVTTGARV